MNGDGLRNRLAGIDPARDVETEPVTTPSSRARLERIMNSQTTSSPTTNRNRWIAGVAAAVAVLAIGGAVIASGNDDSTDEAGPALELDLGASDSMASCLPMTAEIIADAPVAFAATATDIEGETVTLSVTHWYAGGNDESIVVLHAPSGMEALIDGFRFEQGGDYLVAATDGTVSFCGMSGPATPELQALYDEAFAG